MLKTSLLNTIKFPFFKCIMQIRNKGCKTDFFITTPIFYVNASPHIGHLHTVVLADAAQRFQRLQGKSEIIFSVGTDEHGTKVQQASKKHLKPLQGYCDYISGKYKDLFNVYNIEYTHFVRTTDLNHETALQNFWNVLKNNNFITTGNYSGWYCDADEAFLSDKQLKTFVKDGKETIVSADSERAVEWIEEKNYKFVLHKCYDDLKYWIKQSEQSVTPKVFHKILSNWIDELSDLKEISISRPINRVHWGFPVPDDESQTIYVWLDALVNYLTVAGYPNLEKWPPDIQIIGKDILKFHGIYWPAFLIAANLEPPRQLLVHSHWTVNGEKMSKSRGNTVCPIDRLENFTASGLRYFLLREGTLDNDNNFSEVKIRRILNSELADSYGNLLNRCCSKTVNSQQIYPNLVESDFRIYCDRHGSKLILSLTKLCGDVTEHYTTLNYYKGINRIISTIHEANKFFELSKPWELCKSVEKRSELNCVLHLTMEALRLASIALSPVIPTLTENVLNKLNIPYDERSWHYLVPSWEQRDYKNKNLIIDQDKSVLYKKIID